MHTTDTSPFDNFVNVLATAGCDPRERGDRGTALCPAHHDERPSLSFTEGDDGRVLVKCFSGCPTADVIAALNLTWSDLFPRRGVWR